LRKEKLQTLPYAILLKPLSYFVKCQIFRFPWKKIARGLPIIRRFANDRAPTIEEIGQVISRNIKPGHEKDCDDWFWRYMILENKVPGYLGTTIIAPGGNTSSVRYIVNRFSDQASMDAWESSGEALKLIGEADNCSTQHYASATGLEAWFSVPF
jgi:antibiotic biosynthesis monooxygenase (ABM) superfamily enzyme